MRSAEQALDHSWEHLDQRSLRRSGRTFRDSLEGIFCHCDVQRTPEWKQPDSVAGAERSEPKTSAEFDVVLLRVMVEERTESTVDHSQPSATPQKIESRNPFA